mgnify:FL=1
MKEQSSLMQNLVFNSFSFVRSLGDDGVEIGIGLLKEGNLEGRVVSMG